MTRSEWFNEKVVFRVLFLRETEDGIFWTMSYWKCCYEVWEHSARPWPHRQAWQLCSFDLATGHSPCSQEEGPMNIHAAIKNHVFTGYLMASYIHGKIRLKIGHTIWSQLHIKYKYAKGKILKGNASECSWWFLESVIIGDYDFQLYHLLTVSIWACFIFMIRKKSYFFKKLFWEFFKLWLIFLIWILSHSCVKFSCYFSHILRYLEALWDTVTTYYAFNLPVKSFCFTL